MMSLSNNGYPKVFMFHIDGGHISQKKRIPAWQTKGQPSQFKIIPVNQNHELVVTLPHSITTRANYIQELISWQNTKVVLQECEKGKFLKCNNKFTILATLSGHTAFPRPRFVTKRQIINV